MMSEMMKQCCGIDGKPDFEKMKQFMPNCGKEGFGGKEIAMMKQFCGQEGMPDMEKMKELMEKCGCQVPRIASFGNAPCVSSLVLYPQHFG